MKLLIHFNLLAMTLALSLPNQRIIAGVDTTIGDIPYQVSIQFLGHICSGSVIAPLWVITAASCVAGLSEQATQIRWGSSYHNEGGSLTDIEKINISPDYNRSTFLADIALIKTKQVMNVLPVLLANTTDTIYTAAPVVISGWGVYFLNSGHFSKTLQKATIPYMTLTRCSLNYATLNVILPDDMFCGGDSAGFSASICRGDIGGPATFLHDDDGFRRLYGIASFTITCGGVGQPSVFTDVRPYRAWISEISSV